MVEIKRFTKDMLMGDALKLRSGAEKVFQKYFGDGCWTCPGFAMEDIAFGALMHNLEVEVILQELNELPPAG